MAASLAKFPGISTSFRSGLARVVLDAPKKLNALDLDMVRPLTARPRHHPLTRPARRSAASAERSPHTRPTTACSAS